MSKIKLGIFLEVDDKGKETGRFQVAETKNECVWDTFPTEEKAIAYMKKEQTKLDRNEAIRKDYLNWEPSIMRTHHISRQELRHFLVNDVCI
ncbi:MAG TPA: hypothetical protein VMW64_01040 [Dehalococcoidia bacterium]|nr:hypothetical protein [Dehalococcoidia bacterium]